MALLVSHVPDTCTFNDVENLFASHGELIRCLISRAEQMALVEYKNDCDAENAINHLHEKVVHDSKLTVEWMTPDGSRIFGEHISELTTNVETQVTTITLMRTMNDHNLFLGIRLFKNKHTNHKRLSVEIMYNGKIMYKSSNTSFYVGRDWFINFGKRECVICLDDRDAPDNEMYMIPLVLRTWLYDMFVAFDREQKEEGVSPDNQTPDASTCSSVQK